LYLDGRHRPIAYSLLSIGTATASLVHPREVYQPAVLLGAVAILALHNHPSNDPRPSTEDRDLTQRLAEAGRTIGIELLDHIVWTRTGAWRSLRDDEPQLFSRRLDP
jgi:DNA repair protein RadC